MKAYDPAERHGARTGARNVRVAAAGVGGNRPWRSRAGTLCLAAFVSSSPLGQAATSAMEYDFAAQLQPVPATAIFSDPDYNIWCGSAVKGDDGQYHLFYSRWPRALGHHAWVTHSAVAHAVSDSPFGPWRHRDVALPPRGTNYWDGSCTHNPTVLRQAGKFYLYYMGNYGDGVARSPLNWDHRNRQRIGVAVADSPNGPWQRFDQPLVDTTPGFHDALCCNNPSEA